MPQTGAADARVEAITQVYKQYYELVSKSISARAMLIQDPSVREGIAVVAENQPPSQLALFICKLLVVLSDQRKHAKMLGDEGYIPVVARFTEQAHLPLKLVTKFLQLHQRLVNAQKDQPKPEPKRRTKEMVFILPLLNEIQQHSVSQSTLQGIKGMVSVSFRSCAPESKVECVIRCLLHVEAKEVADQIMKVGLEEVGYLHTNDRGATETFTFYRDADQESPEEGLPQYLDENIIAFDPRSAVVTNDFKPDASSGWLSSAKQLLGFW